MQGLIRASTDGNRVQWFAVSPATNEDTWGVADDLVRRVWQRREWETRGFTSRCAMTRLVQSDDARTPIRREKSFKLWPRDWRLTLIEKDQSGLA